MSQTPTSTNENTRPDWQRRERVQLVSVTVNDGANVPACRPFVKGRRRLNPKDGFDETSAH